MLVKIFAKPVIWGLGGGIGEICDGESIDRISGRGCNQMHINRTVEESVEG